MNFLKQIIILEHYLVLLFLTVSFFLILSCRANEEDEPSSFTLLNRAEPETLDPHLMQGYHESRIYHTLFDGLTSLDPHTMEAIPGLAESWEVSSSGLIYTFHLRKSTWSDGITINAHTVRQSWIRLFSPETASQTNWQAREILKGATDFIKSGDENALEFFVRADYVFEVHLEEPTPHFLKMLAEPFFAVLPMHQIEAYPDSWLSVQNWVSNGAFLLSGWVVNDHIEVRKNPIYWNKATIFLDKINFLVPGTFQTNLNLYHSHEIDWFPNFPYGDYPQINLEKDYLESKMLGVHYIIPNHRRPYLDDVRFRQALSMAIDKKRLVEYVLQQGATVATGLVPPMENYLPIKGLEYNISQAKTLLQEALGEEDPQNIRIHFFYHSSDLDKRLGEFLQNEWQETLGIKIVLEGVDWQTWLQHFWSGDFDLIKSEWNANYEAPEDFLNLFIQPEFNDDNIPAYRSFAYHNLVMKGRQTKDIQQRYDLFHEADFLISTLDTAIIPLYYPHSYHLINTAVWKNWNPNVYDIHPLNTLYKKE